jgi:hypothetical protein
MGHKSGRNVLVTIKLQKYIKKIKVHLLVFNTFYATDNIVLWGVTPSSLLEIYHYSGGMQPFSS